MYTTIYTLSKLRELIFLPHLFFFFFHSPHVFLVTTPFICCHSFFFPLFFPFHPFSFPFPLLLLLTLFSLSPFPFILFTFSLPFLPFHSSSLPFSPYSQLHRRKELGAEVLPHKCLSADALYVNKAHVVEPGELADLAFEANSLFGVFTSQQVRLL